MNNFISVPVKCPLCGESLMDNAQLVDNEKSIRLIIKIEDKKGIIRLSSIYGSFNHISDIEIPPDAVAYFYCPHCKSQLTSDIECKSCSSNMFPFNLDIGGKVSICAKSGCQHHLVEFENFSDALKKLYAEYGFRGGAYPKDLDLRINDNEEKVISIDEEKEIIESGTFLQTYCPYCNKSLIENDMLKLKIENGTIGYLMLSPYLNVFTSKSTMFLPEDKTVENISCPHCNKNLIETENNCGKCGSRIAKVSVSARTKFIDFYLCTKKGCKWHGLTDKDYEEIRLEDSLEW